MFKLSAYVRMTAMIYYPSEAWVTWFSFAMTDVSQSPQRKCTGGCKNMAFSQICSICKEEQHFNFCPCWITAFVTCHWGFSQLRNINWYRALVDIRDINIGTQAAVHRLLCATDTIGQKLLDLSSSGGGKEELLLKKTLHKIPLLFSTTAFAITSYPSPWCCCPRGEGNYLHYLLQCSWIPSASTTLMQYIWASGFSGA